MKRIVLLSLLCPVLGIAMAQRGPDPKLKALLQDKDSAAVQQKLATLGNSDKEEDRGLVLMYYNQTQQAGKADSILTAIKTTFPQGRFAFIAAGNAVIQAASIAEKQKLYDNLVKQFPGREYTYQQYELAIGYAAAGNKTGMLKYAQQINDSFFRADAFVLIAQEWMKKGDPAIAKTLVKESMNSMAVQMPYYDSAKAIQTAMASNRPPLNPVAAYYRFEAIYSGILLKQKQHDSALYYAKSAYEHSSMKTATIQDAYLNALIANHNLKEAFPLIERAFKDGRASALAKDNFQAAYKAVNGSASGFETYKTGIENEIRERFKTQLVKKEINEPVVDFTLTDVDGKTVSLHDMKGKVVILDFWATWCGPCKRSFPAMQLAVNAYKNDPNVQFLFIHTWERGNDDPSVAAKKYISDNKYSFQVLVDKKDPQTGINKVVTNYKISGIPTKLVIDANGNVRFRLTGFSGGDDMAVMELSAMIDLAKKGN